MDAQFLDQLIRIVAEGGRQGLWRHALPWIAHSCRALGARILIDLAQPARHTVGELSPEVVEAIEHWEARLVRLQDWVSTGSLSSMPPVPVTTLRREPPLIHIAILNGGRLEGGLSVLMSPEDAGLETLATTATSLANSVARLGALAAQNHGNQRKLTQLGLLYEASRTITGTLNLPSVLEYTTTLATTALDCEASSLMLADWSSHELVFTVSVGESGGMLRAQRMPMAEGVAGWVARFGQPAIVNETAQDSRFNQRFDQLSGFVTRNILCVPLQTKGEVLGVLEVLNKHESGLFDEEDLEWLTTLGSQAAIAVENARLYTALQAERDRILEAEAEIREELARNLHDTAAQALQAMIMNIELARRLAVRNPDALDAELDILKSLVQQANQEIRQMLFELRPLLLQSQGLVAALKAYAEQQERLQGFHIEMRSDELPSFTNRRAEAAVFMIIQEALNNSRRHAKASVTWLRLSQQADHLVVEIEDNGTGFDLAATQAFYDNRGSLGLLNMRERAERLGGILEIRSPRPNGVSGTLVYLEVPLQRLLEDR